ncbi:hypothetical protein Tco_1395914 [Tanacetum coccineum]
MEKLNVATTTSFSEVASGAHDKKRTRADVLDPDWSANDWSALERTKILPDQSEADTSAPVPPYHVPLRHILEKPFIN